MGLTFPPELLTNVTLFFRTTGLTPELLKPKGALGKPHKLTPQAPPPRCACTERPRPPVQPPAPRPEAAEGGRNHSERPPGCLGADVSPLRLCKFTGSHFKWLFSPRIQFTRGQLPAQTWHIPPTAGTGGADPGAVLLSPSSTRSTWCRAALVRGVRGSLSEDSGLPAICR